MYVKNLGFGLDYSHRLVSIKCSGQLPIWLVWTQPSGGRAGSMMHSWGNSCSLPIAFCERGAERLDLAALMLRQSSGSAAQWALLTPLRPILSLVFRGWGVWDSGTVEQELRLLGVCLISEPLLSAPKLEMHAGFYLNSFLLRSLDFRKSTYSETREVVGGRKLWDNWWSPIASETSRNHLVACSLGKNHFWVTLSAVPQAQIWAERNALDWLCMTTFGCVEKMIFRKKSHPRQRIFTEAGVRESRFWQYSSDEGARQT